MSAAMTGAGAVMLWHGLGHGAPPSLPAPPAAAGVAPTELVTPATPVTPTRSAAATAHSQDSARRPASPRDASTPRVAAAATSRPAAPPTAPAIGRVIPSRVLIPAIGVNAAIVPEGTDASGALQMPSLTAQNLAAWWDGGPAPGQDGPAVLAGHVDSAQAGPLVFWNLRFLRPGDTVTVEPAGVTFTVTAVTQVPKSAFPTAQVYGPAVVPELRLITCGGAFDPATGHYLDNVIVYASERPHRS